MGAFTKEFFFSKTKRNEIDAQSFCATQGGTLYEVMDSRVRKDVTNHAKKEDLGEFWLGINDKNADGTFVFMSDGSPVSSAFLNWIPNAPNTTPNNEEDCVDINSAGQLNDIPCDVQRSVVCESK